MRPRGFAQGDASPAERSILLAHDAWAFASACAGHVAVRRVLRSLARRPPRSADGVLREHRVLAPLRPGRARRLHGGAARSAARAGRRRLAPRRTGLGRVARRRAAVEPACHRIERDLGGHAGPAALQLVLPAPGRGIPPPLGGADGAPRPPAQRTRRRDCRPRVRHHRVVLRAEGHDVELGGPAPGRNRHHRARGNHGARGGEPGVAPSGGARWATGSADPQPVRVCRRHRRHDPDAGAGTGARHDTAVGQRDAGDWRGDVRDGGISAPVGRAGHARAARLRAALPRHRERGPARVDGARHARRARGWAGAGPRAAHVRRPQPT